MMRFALLTCFSARENFLLQGKILSFTVVSMSLASFLFPKCSEDLVQKIISLGIFDTNCSFKQ